MNAVAHLVEFARRLGVPWSEVAKLTPEQIREAKTELEEAVLSHDEIRRTLSAAVKATKPSGNGFYCWVRDVFDDHLVYEEEAPTGTTLWQQTYTIDADGKLALGDAMKVKATTAYVPVKEAFPPPPADPVEESIDITGDVVDLVEAIRKDGTIPLRLIAPGWGSSGYYSKEVLSRDGAKVFPKGTHMYWDHPTKSEESERPERSVKDLAATTTSAPVWKDNGAVGPGLYADAAILKPYQETVGELAPHIGVSIRASGTRKLGEAEGKKGQLITSLIAGESVDFVTKAGAGGQVVQLFEAARGRGPAGNPAPVIEEDSVSEQELKEARERAEAAEKERDAERAKNARLVEAGILREARDVATEALGKVEGLHPLTRERLVESFSAGKPPVKEDGALDREKFAESVREAAAKEIDYLAKTTGSGRVTGLGGGATGDATREAAEGRIGTALGKAFRLTEAESKTAAAGRSH